MNKMKKRYKCMIILGILLVLTGLGLIMQSKADKQIKKQDTEQYTSTTQTQQEGAITKAEYSQDAATEQVTEQSQKQDDSNTAEKKDKTDKVPKDKWPYGNELYLDYDEPMRVREFHNNKEYYDAVVEQFSSYKGKDIAFYTDKVLPLEFDNPNTGDGTVDVTSYNIDLFKALMKYTRVTSIYATGDFVDFHFETTDDEAIWYFYDENISEETSEYINHNYMVNIAPHWWWVELGPGA